jgi:hypothetical protein
LQKGGLEALVVAGDGQDTVIVVTDNRVNCAVVGHIEAGDTSKELCNIEGAKPGLRANGSQYTRLIEP